MLKNVGLPAPFGPIRLTIEPEGTTKSTSSTATRPPNSLRSSCVSSSTSVTGDLQIVQRLVVHAFGHFRGHPRARDQPFRPEGHDDGDDCAEDFETVQPNMQQGVEEAVVPGTDNLRRGARVRGL